MKKHLRIISLVICMVLLSTAISCKKNDNVSENSITGGSSSSALSENTEGENTASENSSDETSANSSDSSQDGTGLSGGGSDGGMVSSNEKGVISGSMNINKEAIPESNADYDSALLKNPDRGLRMETKLSVDGKTPNIQNDPTTPLYDWMAFYRVESPMITQAYFYLTGYRDTEKLPQEAFDRMQKFCDAARENNIKLLLRFAYQYDQSDSGGTVRPGEKGEAKQSIMMAHLDQLKPFIEKNKDIIYAIQAGMIGAWGEWHSYSDSGEYAIDEAALLKKLIEVTPENLTLQVRNPNYKVKYGAGLSESQLKRIGHHNDAVFGVYQAWTGGINPGTSLYKTITEEAPYFPIDGEMFWGWQINSGGTPANAFADSARTEIKWQNIIGQLAEQRFTTFSLHHSYRETEGSSGSGPFSYSMDKWKQRKVTPAILDSMGLFYSNEWFKNSSGKTVERNAFEYLRDYLGYRISIQNFSAKGKLNRGNAVSVSVNLINNGFSAAFNIESGFAVLDANGKVISTVKAGTPSEWHSRTPGVHAEHTSKGFQTIGSANKITHNVSANIKLPNSAGVYRIAFYAKSTNGQFVNFANKMDVKNGYHILQSVRVD